MGWNEVGNLKGVSGASGATGDQGATGSTGVSGITYRGPWSDTDTYIITDVVSYEGSVYVASAAKAAGQPEPVPNPDFPEVTAAGWDLFTVEGAPGARGATGATGADSLVAGPTGATGADSLVAGPTGATGADSLVAGPTGATGADSLVAGPTGATGAGGATGAAGARGTRWFSANGDPGSAPGIAATGSAVAGDYYLNALTGQYFVLS